MNAPLWTQGDEGAAPVVRVAAARDPVGAFKARHQARHCGQCEVEAGGQFSDAESVACLATRDSAAEAGARASVADREVPAWDDLVARAVAHGDEHVIKFTEACLREHGLRPDPRYAAAVTAAQAAIPRPDDPRGAAAVRAARG